MLLSKKSTLLLFEMTIDSFSLDSDYLTEV